MEKENAMIAVKDLVEKNAPSVEAIKEKLIADGIETIRLEYIDMQGVNRGKILPVEMLDDMFEDGIAFAAAIMQIGFNNSVATVKGLSDYNYDDMKIFPDPSRVFSLPYQEKQL